MHPTADGHRALAELLTAPKPKTVIPVDAGTADATTGIKVIQGQKIAITASGAGTYGWEGRKVALGNPQLKPPEPGH